MVLPMVDNCTIGNHNIDLKRAFTIFCEYNKNKHHGYSIQTLGMNERNFRRLLKTIGISKSVRDDADIRLVFCKVKQSKSITYIDYNQFRVALKILSLKKHIHMQDLFEFIIKCAIAYIQTGKAIDSTVAHTSSTNRLTDNHTKKLTRMEFQDRMNLSHTEKKFVMTLPVNRYSDADTSSVNILNTKRFSLLHGNDDKSFSLTNYLLKNSKYSDNTTGSSSAYSSSASSSGHNDTPDSTYANILERRSPEADVTKTITDLNRCMLSINTSSTSLASLLFETPFE